MQRVEWSSDYEIGIKVIDGQHQRIVDYINSLFDLKTNPQPGRLAEIVEALLDYTYSHFAFEEALMEEAGYEFLDIHRRTHEAFSKRIQDLHQRFADNEDVSDEIGELLQTWLINHIQSDDQSYAPVVRSQLAAIESKEAGNWVSRTVRRYFG